MDCIVKSDCYRYDNRIIYSHSHMVDFKCETNNLSIPEAHQCGMRFRGTNMEYNYTFIGVNMIQNMVCFMLLMIIIRFESNVLDYREHKVIITPNNNSMYEFYKLVYWPSMTAKRMNSTDFVKKRWYTHTDGIGSLGVYTTIKNHTATISHQCSKF